MPQPDRPAATPPRPDPASHGRRAFAPWLIPLALALAAGSLLAPFNHDEDQYFAAARAAFSGQIYRDFIYLQTPLNVWFGQAVLALTPGYGLLALRLATALAATLLLGIVAATNRRLYAPTGRYPSAPLLGVGLIAASYSFLFAASLFRNDMLPALLETAALALAVLHLPGGSARRGFRPAIAAIGLLLGLAASAKGNYGLLPAAPGLWLLLNRARTPRQRIGDGALLTLGFLVGLAPSIVCLVRQPEAFLWQVVHFGAKAPLDWYHATGDDARLTPAGRLGDIFLILIQSPALVALILVLLAQPLLRRKPANGLPVRTAQERQRDRLLDLFLIVSFLAAAVPNPAWRQYFVTLLPPLALRLPGALETLGGGRPRRIALTLLIVTGLAGVIAWAVPLVDTALHPKRSIVTRWRESRWIGAEAAAHAPSGPVASLSPHLLLDSGVRIDPRFVSGVFVYRWDRPEERAPILRQNGVTAASAPCVLAAHPPAALVVGYESGRGNSFGVDLEGPLRHFAESRGYRRIDSPFGRAVLYIRPQRNESSAPSPDPSFCLGLSYNDSKHELFG